MVRSVLLLVVCVFTLLPLRGPETTPEAGRVPGEAFAGGVFGSDT